MSWLKHWRWLGLVAIVALALAGCGGGDEEAAPEGTEPAEAAQPGEGVQVTAARANWDTGYFPAQVVADLLGELGYEVSSPADKELAPDVFYSALASREADYWSNGWFPLHDPQLEASVPGKGTVSENVTQVGFIVEQGALQGYLIDKTTADEQGIGNMDDLKDPETAEIFDTDGNGKANLTGCNDGWGCAVAIDDHIEEFGWGDTIEHVQGEYSALMVDVIGRAARGEPVLYYTWTPNFTVAELVPGEDVVWLESPSLPGEETEASIEGCVADPCEMGFVPNDIRIVGNNDFLAENPAAAKLFELIEIPAVDIFAQNLRMSEGENTQGDIEEHAQEWIESNRDLVDSWLEEARAAG
jgi:glycine betaine/proline transport system substrate-binding protein